MNDHYPQDGEGVTAILVASCIGAFVLLLVGFMTGWW